MLSEVEDEKSRLHHALIIQIVTDATEEIEHGSFYRVLQVFKSLDANRIEEVNQVRRYRNSVAPRTPDGEAGFILSRDCFQTPEGIPRCAGDSLRARFVKRRSCRSPISSLA